MGKFPGVCLVEMFRTGVNFSRENTVWEAYPGELSKLSVQIPMQDYKSMSSSYDYIQPD